MLLSVNNGLYGNRPGKDRYTVFEAVEFCRQAGFEAVDINFFGTTKEGRQKEMILDGDWRPGVEKLAGAIRASGLAIESTHGPYADPKGHTPPQREMYEDYLERSLEATGMLGAKYMVVHPLVSEDKTDTLADETIRYFGKYSKLAAQHGVTLAVENMFSTTPERLVEICEGLDCVACWDTGHANIKGLDQYDSLAALGEKLKVLHIHDNYGATDNHNPPYFGNIDWERFVAGLRDIGFGGMFNFEINVSAMPEQLRMENAKYIVRSGLLMLGRL